MSDDHDARHELEQQRLLEEERQAIEEDRARYDSVIPGFSRETRDSRPDEPASGMAGSPRETPTSDQPPASDQGLVGPAHDDLHAPPGCDLGLCIGNLPSRLSSQAGRPADADTWVAEYAVVEALNRTARQRVAWLWPGRIPLGKLTMLVGDPDVGKSLLTLDLAARVTRGLPMPDRPNSRSPRGHVLLLTSEDASNDTIVPRLEAAGADLSRVIRMHSISGRGHRRSGGCSLWNRPVVLPDDIKALESILLPYFEVPEQIREYRDGQFVPTGKWTTPSENRLPPVRLVVLDTLASFLPRMSSTDNVHIRRLLQPLAELAERYRVAIVAINHLNKSSHQAGQYRPMGSLAFTAVSRAVWGLVRDPQDRERRLLLPVKLNLGPTPTGLAFRTEGMKIVWEEQPVEATWSQSLSQSRQEGESKLSYAVEFLRQVLTSGPVAVRQIQHEAADAGITLSTLTLAKQNLKAKSIKRTIDGSDCWLWELPQ